MITAAQKAYNHEYYLAHRDERIAASAKQRLDDPEKASAYQKDYRVKNKESVRATQKAYREENHDKIVESSRLWHEAHKEEDKASGRARYIKNRDKILAQTRAWAIAHPEARKKSRQAWDKRNPGACRAKCVRRRALKLAATIGDQAAVDAIYVRAQDPKPIRCYYCNKLIPPGERHVDHVWPLVEGGAHAAYNLVISHASCNMKKGAKLPAEVGLLL